MPEFLHLLAPREALGLLLDRLPTGLASIETIPTEKALGRVLAGDQLAGESSPAFARSTVDGFAVRARDTFGASESLPAYLTRAGEVRMGAPADFALQPGQAVLIHTGGMLPSGADSVVMLEYTQEVQGGEVEILRPCAPGENVLSEGEDVRTGELVIPSGTLLRPAEIGGLMALGLTRVPVAGKPRVAILSSGDEIVPPGSQPGPGQVRDVNSYALAALVEQHGGQAVLFGIVPDSLAALRERLDRALAECDLVVITAGSSASTRDLTAAAIAAAGPPGVLVHGVNVRPGKPTILGLCDSKPVIGLPGNPVSALVIAGLFAVPVLGRLLGQARPGLPYTFRARLTTNLPSQSGREDYVPVRLSRQVEGYQADPIFYKSNLIFSLARADGLAHIPADATGLAAGEWVEIEIF
jgi:molybdopterin molybdotransferase